MATTQKMYLGDDEIGITRFGEDGNIINGAFTFTLPIDYLVVAGGGGGGDGFDSGRDAGGGGAGRFVSSSITLEGVPSLSVVVGNGGAVDSNGSDSSLIGGGLTIRMKGGGAGGRDDVDSGDGQDGGSGGGGCQEFLGGSYQGGTATNSPLTSDLAGIGTNGGNGATGAGAGGGVSTQWLDGVTYATGGTAQGGVQTTAGSGGRGGGALLSDPQATAGLKGIVKIRYAGNQKATGGTITQSGGYTYHSFTSNGTFTVTG